MKEYINGYASALLNIALEEKKTIKYNQDAKQIIDIFENDNQIFIFFQNYFIDMQIKETLIKETFFNKIEINLINFLCLLIRKNKFKLLISILYKLIKLIYKKENILEGIIYTPFFLKEEQLIQFQDIFKKKLKKQIYFKNIIDKKLISGFKIFIDNQIIENSILNKLMNIKNETLTNNQFHLSQEKINVK